jgi:xanthine dehydrogenase D subunit
MSITEPRERVGVHGGVGTSAERPDATLKVTGQFAYSSDLHIENALWGYTLRSPHARARIVRVDVARAKALDGVHAVLLHDDVPGSKTYGMKVSDQPVLAKTEVRYHGEPVAVIAAEHPEIARRAAELIDIDYEVLPAIADPETALGGNQGLVHENRPNNLVRHVRIRHGRPVDEVRAEAAVVVNAVYQIGTQDPAFLGPESGIAIPADDGGIDLYVAAQWLHADQVQVAASLGLPLNKTRLILAGVGGAFGGREDLSIHIHACLLALHTQRPVRMAYGREESFVGHVHRHPGTVEVELGARRDGTLVFTKVRMLLDGGAYTSTSYIVIANGCYFAAGAYKVENVEIDGYSVYTNNPPCGAMRGFGAVQSCFAIESAMDKLSARLGLNPVDVRLTNALHAGDVLPTGQVVDGPTPTIELLKHLRGQPLPALEATDGYDLRRLPGGVGNVTHGEGIRRGVGYALGMKAIGFSGGVDDTSTAQVSVFLLGGQPTAEVYSSAAECGQGIITVQAQIVRTELAIEQVVAHQADTLIGDAGSSSASRQTWMTGGAILGAATKAREELLARAARHSGADPERLRLEPGLVVDAETGARVCSVSDLISDDPVVVTYEYHHRRTFPVDDERGQGDAHIAFAYAAHRAVVDVDVDLGLVRVVELATAQDVGKAMNPLAVEGQIEGGSAQGLGLALMEEVQIVDGIVKNPSFTDYLIPTILDMPPMKVKVFEFPHPDAPYGLNGVGEPPNLSSTPAIVNAMRNATGLDLPRIPVRPIDIVAGR